MRVVIAIPCYRENMDLEERASLVQCSRVFGSKYDVVFFAPADLECSAYLEIVPHGRVERFDNSFFTSVSSYSRLLLTPEFYLRFSDYDYMLIYQLDAWVFRDELEYWCGKGYDYIGGPFILRYGRMERIIVGNGGFSLRRISAMLRVLSAPGKRMFPFSLLKDFFLFHITGKRYLSALVPLLRMVGLFPNRRGKYLKQIHWEKHNSEDVVFHFLSKEFTDDGLTMPGIEEAARFSLDVSPERFFQCMPFGAHAWMKGEYPFWKNIIPVERECCRNDK